jgi:putative ABC transport system permease protein
MFANILAATLRNLARNRLYAAISILGLAVAFAAAILVAQFVRNEFSYDRWIPGYQQIYKITSLVEQAGQPPRPDEQTQSVLAGQLRVAFPSAIAIARLMESLSPVRHRPGDAAVIERSLAWADPDIFKVFPLPVLAGDLPSALQQPDTVVITRNMARKYFGRDLPVGDTLQIGVPDGKGGIIWRQMRVTAVLQDLPSNTNLTTEVFASSRSPYSNFRFFDVHPVLWATTNYTFVRLSPKASATDLQRALDIAGQPEAAVFRDQGGGSRFSFHALPLADVHLTPPGKTAQVVKPVGSRTIAYAIAGVAALIVFVAAINFVTLTTARAARRGVEVGVRKATGARQTELMIQFMGETLIQVAVSALIGASLAELLVKPFGGFVQRGLTLDYVRDPSLTAGIAGAALGIGLLASVYPALVLSSFRPAAVLKGGVVQGAGSPLARQALVVVQFAILIGLIVTTATLYRQTAFALAQGLGTDTNRIIQVVTPCINAFPEEVRRLPGVSAAGCSGFDALSIPSEKNLAPVQVSGGPSMRFNNAAVDFGFFETYGVHPLAGRLFSPRYGKDRPLPEAGARAQPPVILNQTAARDLGFSDPRTAIGRQMMWGHYLLEKPSAPLLFLPSEIVGVVPDAPSTVRAATDPTFFSVAPDGDNALSIRMTGRDMPRTVRAIEAAWKRTGNTQPIVVIYPSQSRLDLYLDIIIQGVTIAICAGLAVLIACLGLFALSAYTTERRTKEIGVRKAMGASTRDVVRLLVWQFTVPVLWAIAIALPISFLVMDHWLHQFAYRVDLPLWTFALAAAAALAIAWLTVAYQSYIVARAKPAGALQYE